MDVGGGGIGDGGIVYVHGDRACLVAVGVVEYIGGCAYCTVAGISTSTTLYATFDAHTAAVESAHIVAEGAIYNACIIK